MSHTMNIKVNFSDRDVLQTACKRLKIDFKQGSFALFSGRVEGVGIFLPGWRYPAILKEDNTLFYDNYGGKWGDIIELHNLEAYYGVEKAKKEAQMQGYKYYETQSDEGYPQLVVQL
ncbi:MAG: hypothetical protein HZB79_00585 [Deltaproteobacteria bacterium]|nr:hypothetical protein [Deltaproteobacteria bacterium]